MRSAALLLLAGLSSLLGPACAGHSPSSTAATAAALPTGQLPARPLAVLEEEAGALDATVRGLALDTLILTATDPSGAPWAARAAFDPSPFVQQRAAQALAARLPAPGAHQALLELLTRPGLDSRTRCLGARALPEPAVLDAIRAAAAPDRGQPQACLLVLAEAGDDAAADRLLDALRRGRLRLDLELARALGQAELPGLHQALIDGSARLDEAARTSAGFALLVAGEREGRRMLERAADEGGPEAALEVVDLVLELDGPEVADLLRHLVRSAPPGAATYARLALMAHGEHDGALLRDLATRENPRGLERALRCAAVALQRRPDDSALRRHSRRLIQAAEARPRPDLVSAAAPLIEALGDPAYAHVLEPVLDDEDAPGRLRVAAARALIRLAAQPATG